MIGSLVRGRHSGAILAAALIVVATVPGLVSAANSRTLWIGEPSANAEANVGKLFPTTVSVPAASPAPVNSTLFKVQVLSTDNQTIAHAVLTIDANKQNATGLSLNTFYDPDGGTDATFCSSTANVITCNFGNLGARAERTIAVVVDVASNYVAPAAQPLFWAKVTTNNENGSNQQLFIAASGPSSDDTTPPPAFNVSSFNANTLNTFVPPGQAKQLFTSALGTDGAGNVSTTVNFKAHGIGDTLAITEGTSASSLYPCPTGLACQPFYSEVIAQNGSFGSTPFFTWTLSALVPKSYALSQGFVAHFDTATHSDWTLLFKNKTSLCGTDIAGKIAAQGHCISALSLSKPVNGVSTLIVTVVMDHQGGMKY